MVHWLDEVTYTRPLPLSLAGHTFEAACPQCPEGDYLLRCSGCRLQADHWAGRVEWQAFQDWISEEAARA